MSMKTVVFLVLFSACFVQQAKAQLMMDQAVSALSGAASSLSAAQQQGANAGFIPERLRQMGYTDISQSPSNPSRFDATTPEGQNVTLLTDPTTGQIISAVPR